MSTSMFLEVVGNGQNCSRHFGNSSGSDVWRWERISPRPMWQKRKLLPPKFVLRRIPLMMRTRWRRAGCWKILPGSAIVAEWIRNIQIEPQSPEIQARIAGLPKIPTLPPDRPLPPRGERVRAALQSSPRFEQTAAGQQAILPELPLKEHSRRRTRAKGGETEKLTDLEKATIPDTQESLAHQYTHSPEELYEANKGMAALRGKPAPSLEDYTTALMRAPRDATPSDVMSGSTGGSIVPIAGPRGGAPVPPGGTPGNSFQGNVNAYLDRFGSYKDNEIKNGVTWLGRITMWCKSSRESFPCSSRSMMRFMRTLEPRPTAL